LVEQSRIPIKSVEVSTKSDIYAVLCRSAIKTNFGKSRECHKSCQKKSQNLSRMLDISWEKPCYAISAHFFILGHA
jgi:hypothetical protein